MELRPCYRSGIAARSKAAHPRETRCRAFSGLRASLQSPKPRLPLLQGTAALLLSLVPLAPRVPIAHSSLLRISDSTHRTAHPCSGPQLDTSFSGSELFHSGGYLRNTCEQGHHHSAQRAPSTAHAGSVAPLGWTTPSLLPTPRRPPPPPPDLGSRFCLLFYSNIAKLRKNHSIFLF